MATAPTPKEEESWEDASDGSGSGRELEYFGWVYHLGVHSLGHEYCHLRFLYLKGTNVAMYKRDPHENPGIKPIRKGVISDTLMVEELGRRKLNNGDFYILRFYNRLDETKKGEIACATAGEERKWMEAFEQAKQQAVYDLSVAAGPHRLTADEELDLQGRRHRVRRYAHGLKRLIRIGKVSGRHTSRQLGSSRRTSRQLGFSRCTSRQLGFSRPPTVIQMTPADVHPNPAGVTTLMSALMLSVVMESKQEFGSLCY